jgi:FKBP-type peptidyl-prolyl cis-trans isomerase
VVKIIKEAKKCDVTAEIGDHLSVHYVGRLDDENGKKFDASRDRGQTFNFQLGAGQVSLWSMKW